MEEPIACRHFAKSKEICVCNLWRPSTALCKQIRRIEKVVGGDSGRNCSTVVQTWSGGGPGSDLPVLPLLPYLLTLYIEISHALAK